jgi:hypothetical protein
MLIYSALVAVYLAYLGFAGLTGIFLWPAVVCTRSYQSSLDVFGWLATDSKLKFAANRDVRYWHIADVPLALTNLLLGEERT